MSNFKQFKLVIFYLIYLFVLRVFINIIWGDFLEMNIPKDFFGSFIWGMIKFLHWCLPILILIFFFRKDLKEKLKEKYNFRFNKTRIGIFILIWALLIILQKGFNPHLDFYSLLNNVFLTALIEEFIFRGFVLHELQESFGFKKANIIQSVFFSLNHLPWLYALGTFSTPGNLIILLIFYIFFGLIAGFLTKKTNSIIPATLLHAINNLFA